MSRLRQRLSKGSSSSFLEKFKGKTSTVGKHGITALLNGKTLEFDRTDTLESTATLLDSNKQNYRSRQDCLQHQRRDKLQQYALQSLKLHSQNLKLPRITCTEQSQYRDNAYQPNRYFEKMRSHRNKNHSYGARENLYEIDNRCKRMPTDDQYPFFYGRNE